MNFKCPYCGGSRLEHLRNCPKVYNIINKKQFNEKAKKDYFGESPNVFVGRYGYPRVNVGILSNEDIKKDHDSPKTWAGDNYKIPDIVNLRSELINSRFRMDVKTFDQKFLDVTQEVSMLKKPVDVEINLNKKPAFNINYNQDITPYGPSVKLEKAKITENVSIPKAVDKVVSDDDLKAKNAMNYLYDKGYDEHFLTKVISAGNLGVKQERKLVPTRWSITATDDMIGKKLIDEVNDFSMIQDYSIHFGGYLGNNYLIAFFPDSWSYELFENYIGDPKNPDPSVFETGTDFEGYYGRKTYATNTVGGYYATRLAILEHLKRNKRKSTVLALRFITDEYWMPLGVWVVREATRKALANKPLKLNSKEEVLRYIELFIRRKFSFKFDDIKSKSKLIKNLMMQKKLFEF